MLGPARVPADLAGIHAEGAAFWPLAMARELDDAILHLRFNEPELGTDRVPLARATRPRSSPPTVCWNSIAAIGSCARCACCWKRVFKRIDLTARSLFALIEPGSCFAGFLAELVFAADRALMFAGTRSRRQ